MKPWDWFWLGFLSGAVIQFVIFMIDLHRWIRKYDRDPK